MHDEIELKKVGDIMGHKFLVPDYQRGYRWKDRQVDDLLNDIDDFMRREAKDKDSFYCLQPLVVKETISRQDQFIDELPKGGSDVLCRVRQLIRNHVEWEVVDGQQRLTTIYLILSYLIGELNLKDIPLYSIRYATRESSSDYLKNIGVRSIQDSENNIDFWHMFNTRQVIKTWFESAGRKCREYRIRFYKTLCDNVQFIWYETVDDETIKVFTRLNIGKIPLTNAELIKALFLGRIRREDASKMRARQLEIASQWDGMESRLQDDEFWMLIHEKGFDRPTRIDFIFDLVCALGCFDGDIGFAGNKDARIGKDRYRTFRYFQAYFDSDKDCAGVSLIEKSWGKVKEIYDAFEEWFNDLTLYHYVGYLVTCHVRLEDILREYLVKTKSDFVDWLKKTINDKLKDCRDLDKTYDVSGAPKTQCLPLLLLHNVQTIINQNVAFKDYKTYELPVFYKFPFHLYKKESWNVEHVDSNTENALVDCKDQEEWLMSAWCFMDGNTEEKRSCREAIIRYFNAAEDNRETFEDLQMRILKVFSLVQDRNNDSLLTQDEKNRVWNFTLLDEHTNKSYGNSIFPIKKSILLGKDRGVEYTLKRIENEIGNVTGFEIVELQGNSSCSGKYKSYLTAFVPPVTKSVFLKAFGQFTNNPYSWDKADAIAYKKNIASVLTKAGFVIEND